MNPWSHHRKRVIIAILTFILLVMIGLPAFLLFYRAPTCFDKKLNGDETGVDCGGSCQLLCSAESLPLLLKGDPRVLSVATSTYQVVALVENSNNTADIYRAGYKLKIYDATSTLPIQIIDSETYVPKGAVFAIFEGPLTFPEGVVPARAVLEWDESSLVWQKNNYEYPEIRIKETALSRLETIPKLEAIVQSLSLENAANIDLTALLSDSEGNIFAASKTYIETLSAGGETKVIFTWPKPFGRESVATEIIIRVFPDRSFIR